MNDKNELKELARLFSRLGLKAFGGPATHIVMMQSEVVTKRKWLTEQHFLDLIGATNIIPGPNSTEMAFQDVNCICVLTLLNLNLMSNKK